MLNLSIMPLDENHIQEICDDIIEQQRSGTSTHAMLMMKFNPEGTPVVNKAEKQCEIYDKYREILDRAGARHGVLVQATLGHIVVPYEPYPFQPTVSLVTGKEHVVQCCPYDPDFREYMKEQMRILASHHPSIIMIDDDMGLLYRDIRGCACKHHMAEFNLRAGTNMSREELYAHTLGNTEEDKYFASLYVDVQRDSLVGMARAMREGIDSVDPSIQGIVSGIYTTSFCEFSGDIAEVFAGKGNPRIMRMNGGPYALEGVKGFTRNIIRAAVLRENVKDKTDIFLAETDTCPQNRYSTSASHLHSHYTAAILEGAQGAKHWITRLGSFEPASGKAYRKKLSKYSGFYEKLAEYTKRLSPFGCRIPLTTAQDYRFWDGAQGEFDLAPWARCFLERMGVPLYFANTDGGVIFVDEKTVDGFTDDEIRSFLKGTLVLSVNAAAKLIERGFLDYIGVTVEEWSGKTISGERIGKNTIGAQYGRKKLTVCRDGVEPLSEVIHIDRRDGKTEVIFPGVTSFENPIGGRTIVFSGTPDMPFKYFTAFSLLNETRKKQLVKILSESGNLPVYYPEDAEVYLRAGYLPDGEMMVAFFNLGFDELEDIALVCDKSISHIEKLNPDGSRSVCAFTSENGTLRIAEKSEVLTPVVLFLS